MHPGCCNPDRLRCARRAVDASCHQESRGRRAAEPPVSRRDPLLVRAHASPHPCRFWNMGVASTFNMLVTALAHTRRPNSGPSVVATNTPRTEPTKTSTKTHPPPLLSCPCVDTWLLPTRYGVTQPARTPEIQNGLNKLIARHKGKLQEFMKTAGTCALSGPFFSDGCVLLLRST
jgi:hypothetical protein